MLNELFLMHKGLEAINEAPEIKHNDIQSPGMGTTFRVQLDENGDVVDIDLMTKEQIKNTWSLGNGNKNQFPAIKLTSPLIANSYEQYQEWKNNTKNLKEADYRLLIQRLSENHSLGYNKDECWPTYRNKILERIKQLESIRKTSAAIVYNLFEYYEKSSDGISILEQVIVNLLNKAEVANKDTLKAICSALFGENVSRDNKGKEIVKDVSRVTLYLDYLPKGEADIYVSSRKWVQDISKALFEFEQSNDTKTQKGICALTGEYGEIVQKTYPNEKLSVVGKTILYSKNAGTSGPTVKRYYNAGIESYSINDILSKQLAAAIFLLTSDDKKNKTWSKIASNTGTTPALLVAFCREDIGFPIAPLITGRINNSDIEDFDDYLDATETVLGLLKTSDLSIDSLVELIEIAVIDKANRKVNYSRVSSVGELKMASMLWMSACNNSPEISLYARVGERSGFYRPWIISPESSINILKYKYIRDGQASTEIPSISFTDVMKLFFSLEGENRAFATRCLNKLTNQCEPLFSYTSVCQRQAVLAKNKQTKKSNSQSNTQVLNAVTLMSVLLFKIGRKKEKYMSSFAYKLGQLCAAIDEIHIGYCQAVRSGNIPNSLLGNLIYGAALQNPNKALELLASRIRPYQAWALKAFSESKAAEKPIEDKAIKAGVFAYKWLAQCCPDIEAHFNEQNFREQPVYKAELMLGYLAGRPYEKGQSNDNQSKEGN